MEYPVIIQQFEVTAALKTIRRTKAVTPDKIAVEMI